MAPAPKATRLQVNKRQPVISTFGRISKSAATTAGESKKSSLKTAPAIQIVESKVACSRVGNKRKHDHFNDEEDCKPEPQLLERNIKKPKIQRPASQTSSQASVEDEPSPVLSQSSYTSFGSQLSAADDSYHAQPTTAATLPPTLKKILALHSSFLKALSVHYAHNGQATPAELGSLMKTVTCLWKKHPIKKEDIQRMLALYEISPEQVLGFQPGCAMRHDLSPFRLTSSGAAGSMRICVEYVGAKDSLVSQSKGLMRSPFSEKSLQCLFELDLVCLFTASRNKSNPHLAFLSGPIANFPLLSCTAGTQSVLRQEKASARRTEILQLSVQSQERQHKAKTIKSEPSGEGTEEPQEVQVAMAVKSRTQSLFDRVAAKQAISASSCAPNAASVMRHHAIGHIGEIVEILRMKQQQKSIGRNYSIFNANTTSPTKASGQRVSFSMTQLQSEIKDSVSVPIGNEEVRLCLTILAEENLGGWIRVLDSGIGERKASFVVLEGPGMVGKDVQKMLEERKV